MTRTAPLLAIDPQNDFCDLPAARHERDSHSGVGNAPELPVAGAHADMQRLAAFIRERGTRIDHTTVTLDSHQGRLHAKFASSAYPYSASSSLF